MGLSLLVTASIFDDRKHIFLNGRKKKTKKGIPPSSPYLKHNILKVKKAIQPTAEALFEHLVASEQEEPRSHLWCPPRLPAQEPLLFSEKSREDIGSRTVRFCFYTWKW